MGRGGVEGNPFIEAGHGAKSASPGMVSSFGACTLHFLLDVNQVGLEVENGVLETFTHCAADCLAGAKCWRFPC